MVRGHIGSLGLHIPKVGLGVIVAVRRVEEPVVHLVLKAHDGPELDMIVVLLGFHLENPSDCREIRPGSVRCPGPISGGIPANLAAHVDQHRVFVSYMQGGPDTKKPRPERLTAGLLRLYGSQRAGTRLGGLANHTPEVVASYTKAGKALWLVTSRWRKEPPLTSKGGLARFIEAVKHKKARLGLWSEAG